MIKIVVILISVIASIHSKSPSLPYYGWQTGDGASSGSMVYMTEELRREYRIEIIRLYDRISKQREVIPFRPIIEIKYNNSGCCQGKTDKTDEWSELGWTGVGGGDAINAELIKMDIRLDKISEDLDSNKVNMESLKGDLKREITDLDTRITVLEKNGGSNKNDQVTIDYRPMLDDLDKQIEELEKGGGSGSGGSATPDPIPIGFIYTQLGDQSEPHQLWPNRKWQLLENYAGLFFRAEGSGSSRFANIGMYTQEANQTWISHIAGRCFNRKSAKNADYMVSGWATYPMATGGWQGVACTKNYAGLKGVRLYTTEGEVRPKNTAFKIWKCVE